MLFTGEAHSVWSEPVMHNKLFLAVAGLSGIIGFAIRCDGSGGGGGRTCCLLLRAAGLYRGSPPTPRWPTPYRACLTVLPPHCLSQLHLAVVPQHHHPLHLLPGRLAEQGAPGAGGPAGLQRALDRAQPAVHPGGHACGRGLCGGEEQGALSHDNGGGGWAGGWRRIARAPFCFLSSVFLYPHS